MEYLDALHHRWSPRAFTDKEVSSGQLKQIFESAQLSQSCYNEQPWRYLIATKKDGESREKLEACLMDGNAWAKDAYVIGCSYAKMTFARNGKDNDWALHDLGAASQSIALTAWALGLNTRFMGGYHRDKADALVPDDFKSRAMFAIGYATEDSLKEGPGDRGRRPLAELVFHKEWDQPYSF